MSQMPPRKADVIDCEVFGAEMQYCEITLDPGEMVIAAQAEKRKDLCSGALAA